jgi:PAS domain S-box-containing protein
VLVGVCVKMVLQRLASMTRPLAAWRHVDVGGVNPAANSDTGVGRIDQTETLPDEVKERLAALSEHDELVMLRDAIQASNNVVILTDPNLPDNPIVYINNGFEKLTGYCREEALGRNCRFLQGDDRAQEGVRRLREAIAARREVQVELRNYRKDGTLFWNELHLTPVFEGERLKYFLGVQNDVTRRKEAEAGQALMLQAVENANEAVLVTGAQHDLPGPRIEYVNRAFISMTGYELEEVVGKTPRMFQGPKTDRAVLDRMRQQLSLGEPFEGEAVNYRKDGSAYVVAWHVAPIRDEHGRVVNWVSTQRDVTERRRLERETLDVSAREQRRIVGDLHDALQQQLFGTAMYAKALARDLVREGSARAEQAEQLHALMQENVKGLRSVVQGVVPVQPNEDGLMVSLESLATRTVDLYGVPCVFVCEAPVRFESFELATQLYYIAQEAVFNAVKHAKARTIEMSLIRADEHVTLTVRDDGKGFSLRTGEGRTSTGMGLQLMAYRARLVGIQFDVASQVGVGTTVTCMFKLP